LERARAHRRGGRAPDGQGVQTGEDLGGRYFWCSDGLIVREPSIDSMTQVITGLLYSGELEQVLQRLDDE
jgi:hypothetical protein